MAHKADESFLLVLPAFFTHRVFDVSTLCYRAAPCIQGGVLTLPSRCLSELVLLSFTDSCFTTGENSFNDWAKVVDCGDVPLTFLVRDKLEASRGDREDS